MRRIELPRSIMAATIRARSMTFRPRRLISFKRLYSQAKMKTFQYPGVNLNLRIGNSPWEDSRDDPMYPIGVPESSGSESAILPVREVAMMMFMDKITDKPRWYEKVFDEAIVQKWREEVRQKPEDDLFKRIMQDKERNKIPKPHSRIISQASFEFCIEELRNKAEYFAKSGLIPTYDSAGNSVVKSDSAIDKSLHDGLVEAFDNLRHDQEACPDWHPRSNDTVQDLVHPSMYPYVYGRSNFIQEESVGVSTALDFMGQGAPLSKDDNPEIWKDPADDHKYSQSPTSGWILSELWSTNYQWLPANVAFRDDGTAQLTSYVNNLHPQKFPDIYQTIERLIDRAIPAWDQCLREVKDYRNEVVAGRTTSRFAQILEASDSDDSLWLPKFDVEKFKDAKIELSTEELIEINYETWLMSDIPSVSPPNYPQQQQRQMDGLPPLLHNITDEALARAKWMKLREAALPEPQGFWKIDYTPKQSLRDVFKENGLQIIVKMASIELTPEKPEFPVGGWHIEGQMNEKICATALYYLDSDNITSSHLSFRMRTDMYIDTEITAEQDEYNYLERVYGTALGPCGEESSQCDQTFGDVETREGRLLAFPNVFHHRVSSFRLKDPTKPGRRRFIALWLVDPHRRIISTANVPPQQKDWWVDAYGMDGASIPESLMSVEEANEHRLKLMDERTTRFREGALVNLEYHFCEH